MPKPNTTPPNTTAALPGEATAGDQPMVEATPAKPTKNAPNARFWADEHQNTPGDYVIDPATGQRVPA